MNATVGDGVPVRGTYAPSQLDEATVSNHKEQTEHTMSSINVFLCKEIVFHGSHP